MYFKKKERGMDFRKAETRREEDKEWNKDTRSEGTDERNKEKINHVNPK
jgi:hypothetical protein